MIELRYKSGNRKSRAHILNFRHKTEYTENGKMLLDSQNHTSQGHSSSSKATFPKDVPKDELPKELYLLTNKFSNI